MAQRVQEGAQMPLLQDKHGQSRLNNPSSTGAKQYLVGSTDLPCWFSAHVYVGWAALSFDPAGRTVTRSQLLFAPDTWSPLSRRQRSHIACSTRRGSSPLERQAPLLCCREASAGMSIYRWLPGSRDLVIPMCPSAGNAIGSHPAPLRAAL